MSDRDPQDPHAWARLRFAVIGPLLAAPPKRGELQRALSELANKHYRHPVSGEAVTFSFRTLERWYYEARLAQDPVVALQRQRRSDAGRSKHLNDKHIEALRAQYRTYPSWSVQLHYDNLVALAKEQQELHPVPSYSTVRRYLKNRGWHRRKRPGRTAGAQQAQRRLEHAEVRSYEVDYVNALWHLDFHHGSRKVLTENGTWVIPLLLGVMDDHSRLACHAQWYFQETTEDLVHGVRQAFQKRGLPRALMSDNGAAMLADEFRQGLHALSILHETTLPYSPYQNGKQEIFWATLEGRLMAMLQGVSDLTLARLNEITQVWVEQDYHRNTHSELGCSPLQRFLDAPQAGRDCPDSDTLRRAFCTTAKRSQRRTDGTVSVAGIRFEIPNRYRHLQHVYVRYARWNLAHVELVDPHTHATLSPLYPLDKSANAEAQRRRLQDPEEPIQTPLSPLELPPLLRTLMAEYAATGRPPAFIPKSEKGEPHE
jgi:transposase InsO family protein